MCFSQDRKLKANIPKVEIDLRIGANNSNSLLVNVWVKWSKNLYQYRFPLFTFYFPLDRTLILPDHGDMMGHLESFYARTQACFGSTIHG
jgi:hypothetical protein